MHRDLKEKVVSAKRSVQLREQLEQQLSLATTESRLCRDTRLVSERHRELLSGKGEDCPEDTVAPNLLPISKRGWI